MKNLKNMLATLLMLWLALPAGAQFLRTSYFMENAQMRRQLNPAYLPERGYLTMPVLSVSSAVYSNSIGTKNLIDVVDAGDWWWLDNDDVYNSLKDMNEVDASLRIDVLSFGFYKGKGFWSFDIGIRADGAVNAPKSLFDYQKSMYRLPYDSHEWTNQEFGFADQRSTLNVYTEVGVGYARPINDRITIGGKAKLLLGMGNMDLSINKFKMNTYSNGTASIEIDAYGEANMRGLEMQTEEIATTGETINGISEVALSGFGVGGYGAGIDLGVTYQPIDRLTLSASIIDLGFISWSKSASTVASAKEKVVYAEDDMADFWDRVDENHMVDFDMMALKEEPVKKARTTSLPATLTIGAEYDLASYFSVGALSTTRWGELHTLSELTLSANYHPNRTLGLSGSYSMLKSGGKTFGLGLKLGVLTVGTDYLYLGKNTRSVNAYFGLSFGLGKTRNEAGR